jgi:D-alanine-D-alanine ligase
MDIRTDLPIVLLIDVNPRWQPEEIQERMTTAETLVNSMRAVGHPVDCIYMETEQLPELLFQYKAEDVIIFNLCDEAPGIPRSCALVARKLEDYGFTFTGADARALILSQDKRQIMRELYKHGVNTPRWDEYTSLDNVTWETFPAIVKPAFEHCSYGITRESVVQTPAELISRLRVVLEKFQQPVIVQEFIDGREFLVGVIGNDQPVVLPPAEIDYSVFTDIHDRLFTYESKFDPTSLAYQLTEPRWAVELTVDQLNLLNKMVTTAYLATGCRDYARMDVRLRDDLFYLLDVNHNADISPAASIVLGAEQAGFSYGRFGSLLVNLAAHRHKVFGEPANHR